MEVPIRGFGSDNHSGVHPTLLQAITEANLGHVPAYGTCEYSRRAKEIIRGHFGQNAAIFWTLTGTASNVLCLDALTQPYQAILCTEHSHLNVDECGAPERWTGCKLLPCRTTNGKLTEESLLPYLIRGGDQHYAQPRVLSITQPTEVGTLYSIEELRTLIDFAKSKGLLIHMDGARLSNAVAALGCTFKEMTTDLGVDAVSLGGSKGGFLLGEAVIFPQGDPTKNFAYIRKQALQLPSKARFIAVQFERYFGTTLWHDIASHTLSMAKTLEDALNNLPEVHISYPVQSNAVFAQIPKAWVKPAREHYFFYVWEPSKTEIRLMTSFDTQPTDIQGITRVFADLSR